MYRNARRRVHLWAILARSSSLRGRPICQISRSIRTGSFGARCPGGAVPGGAVPGRCLGHCVSLCGR